MRCVGSSGCWGSRRKRLAANLWGWCAVLLRVPLWLLRWRSSFYGRIFPLSAEVDGKEVTMKYVCKVCGWVYDPAENNGVAFEALPDDWTCPVCGVGKSEFEPA